MRTFRVEMGKAGSGSGVFTILVPASTPDDAKRIAMHQYVGYSVRAVRVVG